MRCSDRVFTWSNGTGVWTSLRHVGRIKASRFESDHATLPWLLIKDRDTEPASQPDRWTDRHRERVRDRQRDRWTPQSWGLHTVKLSEGKRHCKKGTVKTVFFFFFFVRYSHFKSDGLWMGVMNPMTDLSEISRPHRKVRTTSSFAVQKNIDSCLDLGRKGW